MDQDAIVFQRVLGHPFLVSLPILRGMFTVCGHITEEHPEIANSLELLFLDLFHKLPRATKDEIKAQHDAWVANDHTFPETLTIPLYDLFPSMGEAIEHIHSRIYYDKMILEHDLLYDLRKQLQQNIAMAHGLSQRDLRRTKVPLPSEIEEEPYALVEK